MSSGSKERAAFGHVSHTSRYSTLKTALRLLVIGGNEAVTLISTVVQCAKLSEDRKHRVRSAREVTAACHTWSCGKCELNKPKTNMNEHLYTLFDIYVVFPEKKTVLVSRTAAAAEAAAEQQ